MTRESPGVAPGEFDPFLAALEAGRRGLDEVVSLRTSSERTLELSSLEGTLAVEPPVLGALDRTDDLSGESSGDSIAERRTIPKPSWLTEPIPARIGRYVVESLLRGGGMGTLYRARDPGTGGRLVVLKTVRDDRSDDPRLRKRFLEEARLGSKFLHPGICPVLDVVEERGRFFLVLPFIDGETLDSFLWRAREAHPGSSGPLLLWSSLRASRSSDAEPSDSPFDGPREAESEANSADGGSARAEDRAREVPEALLLLLEDLARAVEHLHSHGVVHRDLKPGNVVIQRNGAPVLIDFGLALETGEDRARLTLDGETLGTPAYMAPEQVEGKPLEIDRRTDVYALGVILYELLTLQLPYEGSTQREIVLRVARGEPVPPRALVPSIPRDLEAVCLKAMARDRSRRYSTASEFADDLLRARKREATVARPPTSFERVTRRIQRHATKFALVVSFAALATIAIVLSIALAVERETTTGKIAATRAAYESLENVRRAKDAGLEPAAKDLELIQRYIPNRDDLELVTTNPYAPRSWEIFVHGVERKSAERSSPAAVVLAAPRGQIVSSPAGPFLRILRGALSDTADARLLVTLEDADSGVESRREIDFPRGVAAVTERWGTPLTPGIWTAKVTIVPASGPPAASYAVLTQSFVVVSASARDRVLAALPTTGFSSEDHLERALVLQGGDAEFYEDALEELDSIPPDAAPRLRDQAKLLRARIHRLLGDRASAASLEAEVLDSTEGGARSASAGGE